MTLIDLLGTVVGQLVLSRPLLEDWHTHSVPMVIHQLAAPTDSSRAYRFLDFLPDLYRETNQESCLSLATDALARAYLTNVSFGSRTGDTKIYGDALRATNMALRDSRQRTEDGTIIAVWLLGMHEV